MLEDTVLTYGAQAQFTYSSVPLAQFTELSSLICSVILRLTKGKVKCPTHQPALTPSPLTSSRFRQVEQAVASVVDSTVGITQSHRVVAAESQRQGSCRSRISEPEQSKER